MTQLNTKLVHGVLVTDNATGAVNPPIYNSSTYAFESVESMPRWDYARSGNPTRDFLERQIAQLEHGVRGFAFASGLAAIHAVLSIFAPGEALWSIRTSTATPTRCSTSISTVGGSSATRWTRRTCAS